MKFANKSVVITEAEQHCAQQRRQLFPLLRGQLGEYVGFDLHMMLNNLVYERQSTLCKDEPAPCGGPVSVPSRQAPAAPGDRRGW